MAVVIFLGGAVGVVGAIFGGILWLQFIGMITLDRFREEHQAKKAEERRRKFRAK